MFLWWIFIIAIFGFYKYFTRCFDYFLKKKIPFEKPVFIFGSSGDLFLKGISIPEYMVFICGKFQNSKIFGLFNFNRPFFMINDPILAKELCIKYFENFSDHRVFMDTTNDELIGRSLVCLTGQNWRNMRNILSPIFTGAKIRKMFDLMNVCNINAIESLKSQIKIEQILEMKEFFTNFAVDIIFSTAFGLEVNSFQNPKNKLKEIALRTSNPNPFMMQLKLAGINLFPKVMKKFNIGLMDQNTTEFFRTTILDTMKYREKHNVYRSDMIQLLMEARKELVEKGEFLSDEDIIGQCLLFFLAGFENLSTIMAFGAYELAVNWEIQQKLRQSVDFEEVFEYENIHKLKYLDQFVSEVLRKWPPAPLIERRCTKDCTFNVDDQSVTIEKEKFFFVPVYAFHHNPNYFENPEKFDPDRFIEQNISDAYIPFGIGPRNCIGSRFATLTIKTIIYHLIKNFEFKICDETQIPLKFKKTPVAVQSEKGIFINLSKIK